MVEQGNAQPAPSATTEEVTTEAVTRAGRTRKVWATVLGIVVILGLGAGAVVLLTRHTTPTSGDAASTPQASTPQASATSASSPVVTPSPGFHGDPRTLLLAVPVTATKTPIPGAPDNVMTAEQIAANYSDKAAGLKQLQDLGYQHGAQLQWIATDGTWIGVFLYEFGDASAASSHARDVRDSFASDTVFAAGIDIAGVPDGKVFARTSISNNGRWFSEAVFARDNIAVELFVTGPVRHDAAYAAGLAQSQYALLP